MSSELTHFLVSTSIEFLVLLFVGYEVTIGEIRHRRSAGAVTAGSSESTPRFRIGMRTGLFIVLITGAIWVLAAATYFAVAPPIPTSQTAATLNSAFLTPERRETFRQAAYSADNLGVNRVSIVAVVSESETARFARDLVDLFIVSGFQPYDFGHGDYVGAPKTRRLAAGITIIAPAPSIGAEAVRVAFERIGIQTRRVADRDRTDDYLIVEVGPAR